MKANATPAATVHKAIGMLKHHFWGHYVADIVLIFRDIASVPAALEKLKLKNPEASYRNACGGTCKTEWKISEREPRAIMISAEGDSLKEIESLLLSFGADKKKMNSLATSVDHGEQFSIEIPA